ncbi:hypothetical protein BST81_25305 [Leptolyngbya sp. 'hensonii']|uniref:STAS domain-containing protein n=1 Tax=Leptolyngbya sp. 'hensonii' TaxID=1922337 RepID=UPI00094F61E2|nr:STAS domain-containing protein [Leptolyngbya sp. 'hensonii']OLP15597.1 hypothetical protein BST81_25305 [Leptolyngbya sp. 'hensonii']
MIQIIEFDGRLTGSSGRKLLEVVGQSLGSGMTLILIDLELTSFADSSGLAGLVRSYKLAREAGAKIALCSPQIQVACLLELTFMKKTFDIFDDRQDFYNNWVKQLPKNAPVLPLNDFQVLRLKAN